MTLNSHKYEPDVLVVKSRESPVTVRDDPSRFVYQMFFGDELLSLYTKSLNRNRKRMVGELFQDRTELSLNDLNKFYPDLK